MTPELRAALVANTRARAHAYGAVHGCPEARRRYFRELATVNRLLGDPAAHFDALG